MGRSYSPCGFVAVSRSELTLETSFFKFAFFQVAPQVFEVLYHVLLSKPSSEGGRVYDGPVCTGLQYTSVDFYLMENF